MSSANPPVSIASPLPAIRRIGIADVRAALATGIEDFRANPTHLIVLGLLYPALGLVFGRIASGYDALRLVFPLVAGFALVGPFAAIGLYEISRRREEGGAVSWVNAFDVLRSPRLPAILLLGAILGLGFVLWLLAAQLLSQATIGDYADESVGTLLRTVFTTRAGWTLILAGHAIGFVFAVVTLMLSVVSFPLLLDRPLAPTVGEQVSIAVRTSARAVLANPVPMAAWGLIVAVALVLGSIPLLLGLAVVMPVLGHATWHLYRRLVV